MSDRERALLALDPRVLVKFHDLGLDQETNAKAVTDALYMMYEKEWMKRNKPPPQNPSAETNADTSTNMLDFDLVCRRSYR